MITYGHDDDISKSIMKRRLKNGHNQRKQSYKLMSGILLNNTKRKKLREKVKKVPGCRSQTF